MANTALGRAQRWAALLGMAAFALSGCGLINKLTGAEAADKKRAEDLQLLQLQVMRFADEYVGGISEPILRFQQEANTPEDRLAAQNWRLSQATTAYIIASGPNPTVNALDMVVLASLSRMTMDDAWVGDRFGERARALQEAHRRLEPKARALAAEMLTPAQYEQLDTVMAEWRTRNPNVRGVAYVHFSDFAKSVGRPAPGEEAKSGGLFQMLGLDPLSNLDPAMRELTQARQLAERTIYYAQRVPNLLDMQVQLLTYQLASMPETKSLLSTANQFGGAAASAGSLADAVPAMVAREREAAIKQFMDAINVQSTQLRGMVAELRGALDAGTATSDSLNSTIKSVDQLIARFDKPPDPNAPPEPPGKPFDIADYTAAATEFARTANELQKLIAGIEQGTPVLMQSVQGVTADLQNVIDRALWRLAIIGLVLIGGVLVAMLAYRGITRRWLA